MDTDPELVLGSCDMEEVPCDAFFCTFRTDFLCSKMFQVSGQCGKGHRTLAPVARTQLSVLLCELCGIEWHGPSLHSFAEWLVSCVRTRCNKMMQRLQAGKNHSGRHGERHYMFMGCLQMCVIVVNWPARLLETVGNSTCQFFDTCHLRQQSWVPHCYTWYKIGSSRIAHEVLRCHVMMLKMHERGASWGIMEHRGAFLIRARYMTTLKEHFEIIMRRFDAQDDLLHQIVAERIGSKGS